MADRRFADWTLRQLSADTVMFSDGAVASALAERLSAHTFRAGTVLSTPARSVTGVWLVHTGLVELASGSGKERVLIDLVRSGGVHGDLPLLFAHAPVHTARTVERTELLHLAPAAFRAVLDEYPDLARCWLRSAAARLARNQSRLAGLLGRSLPEQVAWLLLDQASDNRARLSQRMLAELLGARRPSVNRVLHDFAARNLIKVAYRDIRILAPEDLARIARR